MSDLERKSRAEYFKNPKRPQEVLFRHLEDIVRQRLEDATSFPRIAVWLEQLYGIRIHPSLIRKALEPASESDPRPNIQVRREAEVRRLISALELTDTLARLKPGRPQGSGASPPASAPRFAPVAQGDADALMSPKEALNNPELRRQAGLS
jgi:hypothetical protein